MQRLTILMLLGGLLSASLFTLQPARAQSNPSCSMEGDSASVESAVILDCLRAGVPVNIDGVTVQGDLDLSALKVEGQSLAVLPGLSIRNSQFTGSVTAFNGDTKTALVFDGQVDLRGSQFTGTVDFTSATFNNFAHFETTRFDSLANFTQAVFQKGASFRGAVFSQGATFMLVQNPGGLDFIEAQFNGPANFALMRSTRAADEPLQRDVSFSGARFTGAVYFMNAVFENPVYFTDVRFRRSQPEDLVYFNNATFTTLDLTDADFENGQLDLNAMGVEKLVMPEFQPEFLSPNNSAETLTALKDNFRKQGQLVIANEIAYWQNRIQRQEKPRLAQMLETIFLDWTFGYGLKPLNAVWTMFSLILFFAIFYYPEGVLRPAAFAPSKPRERKFTIRLTEIPIAPDEEAAETSGRYQRRLPPQLARAWRAIVFSFGVFTKLSSGSYVAVRASPLVIAEWIIGLMVMAGFLFSLANTNALLRAMLDLLK